MKTPIKLRRIDMGFACQENWEEMPMEGGNKFCERCQQSLIDYSAMSSTEVIAHLTKFNHQPCGRLRKEQLQEINRELKANKGKKKGWGKPLLLGGILLGLHSLLQGQARNPGISRNDTSFIVSETLASDSSSWVPIQKIVRTEPSGIHLKGMLIDGNNEPLMGASIYIRQDSPLKTVLGPVYTDLEGVFEIQIDSVQAVLDTHYLEVSYVGYQDFQVSLHEINQQEVIISLAQAKDHFTIEGKEESSYLKFVDTEVFVTGYIIVHRPWYTKIGRELNYRLKDLLNRIIP